MNQAYPMAQHALSSSDQNVRRVEVRASSRLHFGLFSWGGDARQFGGVGVMVERPGLRIAVERIAPESAHESAHESVPECIAEFVGDAYSPDIAAEFAETDAVEANAADASSELHREVGRRIADFQRHWMRQRQVDGLPPIRWQVLEAPAQHVGLGTGTQLGLAVAAALYRLEGRSLPSAEELAASVGRGLRSAVGAHGFVSGGLIIEPGKLAGETLSPLEQRVAIPDSWRFALIRPQAPVGLHGSDEIKAFRRLPPVPLETTCRLIELARRQIAPAAQAANFDRFGEAIYEYGLLAGGCFAPVQGGPFHGPTLTALVERIRSLGVAGVGQSSWGPTLFAVLSNEANARQFAKDLTAQFPEPLDIVVTAADNVGANIEVS